MKLVWDERKRLANIVKNGLDFGWQDAVYFARAVIVPGHSGRLPANALHDDRKMTAVIFRSSWSEALSVISMRPATLAERRLADV